ncbi:lipoprotein insertase outer membrane protein LolB [Psychromonas hadalis]|uniref:lipoprotein insertase outer membrane protein LolB n=1 Tax=Psychromonas hadalis TaxID=211669 RepID=UPI0004165974|nr:lipoprotein insertase outer membrane protein LolB [Psychromonas hadalis]
MKLRFLYLLLPLLFAGCAQHPNSALPKNSTWTIQQAQLEQLTHWSLSGKLGIFTPNNRDSVDIYWQQSGQDFHIRLSALLGLKSIDIQKRGNETVIIDMDGQRHHSNDTEQLITDLTGFVLPIEYLQQWIKGNPSNASYQLNDRQQVSNLLGGTQNTELWSITYNDYRTVNQTNLPHKLQLTRGDLRLKFSISQWHLPPKT